MSEKNKDEISMGELATVVTVENWRNAPEKVMSFLLEKIKESGKTAQYFTILSEDRFLYDEMMIISADAREIAELREELKAMSAFKSWLKGTKKQLRRLEEDTLDLRRVCQYFLYTYIQAGGKKQELLPKFMRYTYEKL